MAVESTDHQSMSTHALIGRWAAPANGSKSPTAVTVALGPAGFDRQVHVTRLPACQDLETPCAPALPTAGPSTRIPAHSSGELELDLQEAEAIRLQVVGGGVIKTDDNNGIGRLASHRCRGVAAALCQRSLPLGVSQPVLPGEKFVLKAAHVAGTRTMDGR